VSGATRGEVEAAVAAVEEALRHPLLERASTAERVHRELPVMHRLDDGRMLEGVLDLAFVEDGRWTIVDFKTDADMTTRRSEYEQQLRWYGMALLRLTGIPAHCVLFGV
jgi:ATP-dependent exoDNAse (exonuclease V) beta subunit